MAKARVGSVALGIAASLFVTLGLAGPAFAEEPGSTTLSISGQLLVITDFGADLALDDHEAEPPSPVLTYSVITDDGQLIAVDGDFADSAQTGDRFEGTVVIPDEVAGDLDVAPGTAIDLDSALGADVVDATATEEEPLVVESSQVSSAPVQQSVTPGAHTMDVAVVSSSITSGAVTALTATVGAYWVDETDGGISSFTQPSAATAITAACPTSESAYNAVWTSAAATFGRTPGHYTNGSGRHLVVILPAACNSSTGTGLGTIGSSVHQGGLNFVSNYSDIATTTLAHEIGHNVGLGHGNLNYCGTMSYDEGSGCSFYEYNDVYSVMGYAIEDYGTALPALPASQRDFLKGYGSGELAVQAPTSGAPLSKVTYTLKPASDSSGLRGIKVTDPYTGLVYYVELRSGTGSDANAFYAEGFTWRLNGSGAEVIGTDTGVRVLQLDTSQPTNKGVMSKVFAVVTNPGAPTFAFSALHPNEDFNSRSGGLRIRVDAMSPNVDSPTSATVTISTGGWTGTNPPPTVSRIAGTNRFDTSAVVAQQFASADVVYIASGWNYPDALSAAPAAALLNAPLLLTDTFTLPVQVRNEIDRLQPKTIVIAGGYSVVSAGVQAELTNRYPTADVIRHAGSGRYETSRLITAAAFGTDEIATPVAFIATGRNFPDALSASAVADKFKAPVILVDGTATTADQATKDLLVALGVTKVYIVGGTGVVSANLMASLSAFSPTRLAGTDRYSTSLEINKLFVQNSPNTAASAYIATGTGFADALAGAALAGKNNAPLYVVPGVCVPSTMITQMDTLAVSSVALLGGPTVLTSAVYSLRPC